MNEELHSIYYELFRGVFKGEKTFIIDPFRVKLFTKHGDKYKFGITRKQNFQYFHIICGQDSPIVELISNNKVFCGNEYGISVMYYLLFIIPISNTLLSLKNEIEIIKEKNCIQNTESNGSKLKSFTCKSCFSLVLGTVSILKSICSGGCGKFKVSPSPDISIHLFKNESDNFYERLYRALCEKFKHVSKKRSY